MESNMSAVKTENAKTQSWKCESVGHVTFINGNISAYEHIKILIN